MGQALRYSTAKRRGLIEANSSHTVSDDGSPYSTAKRRGLIEATPYQRPMKSSSGRGIPRLNAVAALKRHQPDRLRETEITVFHG